MGNQSEGTKQTGSSGSRLLIVLLFGGAVLAIVLVLIVRSELSWPQRDVLGRFMELKNAGDSAANDLLGGVPAGPEQAVSPEEANHLQTDSFLRGDLRILEVRRERGEKGAPPRYRLVTRGDVAAQTLTIKTDKGTERSQRTMSHPDLIVEIGADGKIYGVRAELHMQ